MRLGAEFLASGSGSSEAGSPCQSWQRRLGRSHQTPTHSDRMWPAYMFISLEFLSLFFDHLQSPPLYIPQPISPLCISELPCGRSSCLAVCLSRQARGHALEAHTRPTFVRSHHRTARALTGQPPASTRDGPCRKSPIRRQLSVEARWRWSLHCWRCASDSDESSC